MTRAGFCTECGDNVYLTDEGACPEGHGPECIRDEYDVEEAPSATAEDVVPAEEQAAPFAPAPVVPVGEVAPKHNRTGLAVFAAAAVLLLVALVAGAFVLMPALNKSKTPEPAATGDTTKARVETTIAFLNALFADDTMKIKPLLTDEAQNAITAAQWDDIASAFPTVTVTFDEPTWSSDSTAVVAVTTGETTATLSVGVTPDTTNTVNVVLDVSGSAESATVSLVQVGTGWRVLSLTDATGGSTLYDDAFVKSLHEEATAQ